jgi:hypothetical protein
VTLRFGKRSTGGVVKAGHGGWTLNLTAPPMLGYTNPQTGDGVSVGGWNLFKSALRIKYLARVQRAKRTARAVARTMDAANAMTASVFAEFERRFGSPSSRL